MEFPSAVLATAHWRRHGVLLLLFAAVACAWLQPFDRWARGEAEAGFKRAVTTFAAARALNGIISVAQGTEFSVQPLGLGLTLTPGQVLDPLNDLVERFSDLMLAASVAFGVQILLLDAGMAWGMSALLTLVALAWGWRHARGAAPPPFLSRLLIALLLLRFVVPAAGLASDAAYCGFMQQQYAQGQQGIEVSTQALKALTPAEGATEQKWWQFNKQIERLEATVEAAVEHAIRLMVVFLLQTLILPLMVIWLLVRSTRLLAYGDPPRYAAAPAVVE